MNYQQLLFSISEKSGLSFQDYRELNGIQHETREDNKRFLLEHSRVHNASLKSLCLIELAKYYMDILVDEEDADLKAVNCLTVASELNNYTATGMLASIYMKTWNRLCDINKAVECYRIALPHVNKYYFYINTEK